ncbi:MAG: cob(I)yrinic acid a,c-diamide adenosyltransferase [Pseudomonadota bacterium]
MANRLSKIVTRTGDDGSTGLGDGTRVAKDAPRIEAIGAVDELNSQIGVLLAEPLSERLRDCLIKIQHTLFDLGGELSIPGRSAIGPQHITQLEQWVEHYNADLPALKEFILPGGCRAAALCHVARTVCRRAERRVIALQRAEPSSPHAAVYLNRLSDLLFILCRAINRDSGHSDVLWQHDD